MAEKVDSSFDPHLSRGFGNSGCRGVATYRQLLAAVGESKAD